MSFIRRWIPTGDRSIQNVVELLLVFALVAAVGLPLVVFIPGSRRRRAQIVELRDFTDCPATAKDEHEHG